MGTEISRSNDQPCIYQVEEPPLKLPEPEKDIMIVGSCRVGKTSLYNKLVGNNLPLTYSGTIGIEPRTIKINTSLVTIWDTLPITNEPGPIHEYLIDKCSIFILVFSLIDRSSWLRIGHACRTITDRAKNPIMILVGTFHSDAPGAISDLEIETLRMQYSDIFYIPIQGTDYSDVMIQLEQIIT